MGARSRGPNAQLRRDGYVDNDPLVVAYGTEILGAHPNARYLQADIRDIESVLASGCVRDLLGDATRSAAGFNAVTCFLIEEEISRISRAVWDWAPRGSRLFATFETKDPDRTPEADPLRVVVRK